MVRVTGLPTEIGMKIGKNFFFFHKMWFNKIICYLW